MIYGDVNQKRGSIPILRRLETVPTKTLLERIGNPLQGCPRPPGAGRLSTVTDRHFRGRQVDDRR